MNREEILLHDKSSWQKLAQLEENIKPSDEAKVKEAPEKKRDTKAYNKLVKNALKQASRHKAVTATTCGKEQMLKEVVDKALIGFKFSNNGGIK